MTNISIRNFSCLDRAEVTLGRLTVLVGPQASGKSIISKLLYFLTEKLSPNFDLIRDLLPISDQTAQAAIEFRRWFPPSAWGQNAFEIEYSAGPAEIRVARRMTKGSSSDEVTVTLSSFLVEQHESLLQAYRHARKAAQTRLAALSKVDEWDLVHQIRRSASQDLQGQLAAEYVGTQIFVPAGRSFFTSLGKAVAAFERSGTLDPVTVQFGRYFTSFREAEPLFLHDLSDQAVKAREQLMRRLLGGTISKGHEHDYLETDDGRRIPFFALSSGQQELLPLLIILDSADIWEDSLTYIEEPEAHLFPSTQNILIEHLSGLVAEQSRRRRMVITTHSPYALAKINNLMKAGAIAQKLDPSAKARLSKIVKPEYWLSPGSVAAYAIKDRSAQSIVRDDLIEADYLDEVSGEIAAEFSRLLEFEIVHDDR